MISDEALKEYYNQRAREYESIYERDDPVRQAEQTAIATTMKEALKNRRVLEVACGTGFWTRIASETAQQIVATDGSSEMLKIARSRSLPPAKVQFLQADAFDLDGVPGTFDAALANFWFSHIPKTRINEFLQGLNKRIGEGGVVFMADNMYLPGIGGELISKPESEDTYKLRDLSDGSRHLVLKNYYTEDQISLILRPLASNVSFRAGHCFWWLSYQVV